MKKALIALAVILSACTAKQEQIILFNEQNGDNQMIVLREDTVETAVFYIEDGVLTATGNPFGYIRTTERYQNYELSLEWRWVEEPSNSGVLLHISGEDQVWPHCIEAQLKHESAGDFVLIREGAKATIDGQEHVLETGGRWASSIKKMQPSSENTPGEWNHYRIITHDGNMSFYVNSVLQSEASDVYPTSGYIGLQSEGTPIQFRNIVVKKLTTKEP